MTEKEKMQKGLLYDPSDEEIYSEQVKYLSLIPEYNATRADEPEKRAALLKQMLKSAGKEPYIEAPFYANWGGKHVSVGDYFYANFGLTLVDDGNIDIGDYVLVAPNVTIATGGHPVDPSLRAGGRQYNADVKIGNNVWIGAGAIICPGVTIGDNTVIGAGSVVVCDIPSDVVAVGNPCRVKRRVNDRDKEYYFRDRKVNL